MSLLCPALQDVIDQGYTVYTLKGTALEAFFLQENLPEDSPIREAYHTCVKPISPKGHRSVFLEEASKDPLVAFFGSKSVFVGVTSVVLLEQFEEREGYQNAIGLLKDSELKGLFDHHLLKMKQSGLLGHFMIKWMRNGEPEDGSGRIFQEETVAMGYQNLFGPSFVVLVGFVAGCLLSLVEKAHVTLSRGQA